MDDRCDRVNPDDQLFTVTTTVTLYAKDPKQAVMKAFALHDSMTPEDYTVTGLNPDPDDLIATSEITVVLDQDEKDEARRAYHAGEYFRTSDLKD